MGTSDVGDVPRPPSVCDTAPPPSSASKSTASIKPTATTSRCCNKPPSVQSSAPQSVGAAASSPVVSSTTSSRSPENRPDSRSHAAAAAAAATHSGGSVRHDAPCRPASGTTASPPSHRTETPVSCRQNPPSPTSPPHTAPESAACGQKNSAIGLNYLIKVSSKTRRQVYCQLCGVRMRQSSHPTEFTHHYNFMVSVGRLLFDRVGAGT